MLGKKLPIFILLLTLLGFAVIFTTSLVAFPSSASTFPKVFAIGASTAEPRLKPEMLRTEVTGEQNVHLGLEFVKRWEDRLLSEAGWIHLVCRVRSDVDNGVILPDGSSMPLAYLKDGWYYLDEQGLVQEFVSTLKTEEGAALQVSVFDGKTTYNLTFDERFPDVQPFKLKLDLGFRQYLQEAEGLGVPVHYREIERQGQYLAEVSLTEVYDTPVQLGNSPEPVSSLSVLGLFDLNSGAMQLYRMVWQLESGKQVLFEESEFLQAEFSSDAPSEVMEILEDVK